MHARVVGELAQPLYGRVGVGGQDLLDGEHIGVEGPDHPGDHLVVLPGLRRVAGKQLSRLYEVNSTEVGDVRCMVASG